MTGRVLQVGGGRLGGGLSHPADGNVWAVRTGAGVLVVDAGTGLDPDRLAANLRAEGIGPGDVRGLLLTHAHLDHSGGAAWFHERWGVPVTAPAASADALAGGDEGAIGLPLCRRQGADVHRPRLLAGGAGGHPAAAGRAWPRPPLPRARAGRPGRRRGGGVTLPGPAAAAAEPPVRRDVDDGTIRVAVCGLGAIGSEHLANLRTLRGCAVAGVFDRDPARAAAAADRHRVRAYRSFDALLADPAADAVVLATPAAAHRAGTLAALSAGKHVFVEKPLADTLADARAIHGAARAADRVVQVGFCERFNPAHLEAKRAVPALGRVRSVQSCRVGPLRLADPTWPLGPLDTAVHNFDLALWLTGWRPVVVTAFAEAVYLDWPGPTAVTTVVECDGGTAVDHVAWVRDDAHPLAQCARSRLTLHGDRGAFDVDLTCRPARLLTADGYRQPDTVILGGPDYYGCLKLQLDAFLAAVAAGGPSPVPTAAGLAAEAVAVAALESVRTGRRVAVEGVDD